MLIPEPNQTLIAGGLIRLIGHNCLRVFCFLLLTSFAAGAPCEAIKAQPDVWVADQVEALVQSARGAYLSDRRIPAYARVLDSITSTIRECRLKKEQEFLTRYRVFVDYVETVALVRRPDHELGLLVSDEQYFGETSRFVQLPEFLLDQQFLRSVSRYETLPRAKNYLQQLNSKREPPAKLIFFSYKSRHLGTPDNKHSYLRFLIVVPGNAAKEEPEQWVQFGVTDPGARARVRNVSIVSVVPGEAGTFNAYFKDFYRSYHPDGAISIKGRWESGEGDDNCTQCHKSGILPVFPAPGSVNKAEQPALLAVNERFRSYGSARFGRYFDATKLGPGLGAASQEDRRRRFGVDFSAGQVGKAMVCSSCHNAERLGALNWPMDRILISSFVRSGQMPAGHELNRSNRRALYMSLIREYFATDKDNPGILKSWLLSVKQ